MQKIVWNGEHDPRRSRDVFSSVFAKMYEEDHDVIYVDADMMHSINMAGFAEEHPDRAISVGIAEANMVGVACGLAATGFKPFIHTFGPFVSRRVFDQVFLSAGYAKNDITVIGSDAGVYASFNGGTHMPFEDMALYRSLPGATVMDIADVTLLADVLRQCPARPGVKYIRMGRNTMPKIYADDAKFTIGKAELLRDGTDIPIFAAGIMLHEAMQAAQMLEKEGIHAAVYDFFTIKPIDRETVVACAKKFGAIVTAENHNKIGGLYSAVIDELAQTVPVPVEYAAVNDEFGEVGPIPYLLERYELTAADICKRVHRALERKAKA